MLRVRELPRPGKLPHRCDVTRVLISGLSGRPLLTEHHRRLLTRDASHGTGVLGAGRNGHLTRPAGHIYTTNYTRDALRTSEKTKVRTTGRTQRWRAGRDTAFH